ncbi:uncharacterized protein HMPREF1541_09953 [Cyphellophora europaea CBS 101466]|uniref:Protein kinase domain-containing protein n=1 Tax=Cyphellophora europaea (strain CBS 101466) TaxID=1220924 RepID=W2S8S4_CYPE1|nr:uncharacterized protein HMPREF1541_09953 [Cyphellophora europaea CBS 101466]ETN45077.1 hypothetical protein HMPREF1541_09953 [Cyphellophora europaea CBS 101466]
MAQEDNSHRPTRLRLEISSDASSPDEVAVVSPPEGLRPQSRPSLHTAGASEDTIRATPPIDIPTAADDPSTADDGDPSFVERFMRTRKPSVSFNTEVKLESGQRQSMDEPLKKPARDRARGRSLLQVLADERPRSRAHSEGDRTKYDPVTGRHLPQYSASPPREQPHVGEARFPMLQETVDAMARESHNNAALPMSLTSDSTLSPTEEVRTPNDAEPATFPGHAAFSYDEPKAFRRTASQRWRESQNNGTSTDFFSRAGSLRDASGGSLSRAFSSPRLSRRDTAGSTRSPRSAASSYLRAFSISSSNDGDTNDGPPPAVDAEGQTIGEDYVLGKQIGFGGFSVIKEVIAGNSQRKLAVKIVRRQVEGKSEAENEQVQAEFEHEVELWRFLDHRHILPLEAVYKFDEATFCFIPLSTGGTLFDLVRTNRQGVSANLAAEYAYQIGSALRYLHLDARVVHRDIKLENCLLDRDPRKPNGPGLVRLCDFGMAEWLSKDYGEGNSSPPSPNINNFDRPPQKHIGPADSSTSAFAGGSLEYAAPEILRLSRKLSSQSEETRSGAAERAIVSPAVDVWAFGVCIFSLVVGSRPFQNTFQPRVVMAILAGDWDVERLALKGGDDVVECVKGCLEMEEADRWDISRALECAWLYGITSDSDEESAWKL